MVSLTALLTLALALCQPIQAGTYSQVTSFGSNPSNTKMYTYIPAKLAAKPAIIVAIHYCSGTAQAYYQGSPYAQLSETYGFVVIYPESPYSGTCWDVSSDAALTHDGGADSNSIANMVRWAITQYGADASRVFVTGSSSGAMMTNVMAATYPDLFAAGIAYSGVPAGCFYTGTVNGWNSQCSQGQLVKTPQAWAQQVLAMDPGYTGPRPRMQIYHGSADTTLYPNNFNETLKEWCGVFGYTYGSPLQTLSGVPGQQYTKYIYGDHLEGIYGQGVGHTVPIMGTEDMKFFGFIGGSTTSSPGGPSSTSTTKTMTMTTMTTATTTTNKPPTTTTTTSTAPVTSGQAHYGQCGGNGWTGPKTCVSPYKCVYSNDWYSQCL